MADVCVEKTVEAPARAPSLPAVYLRLGKAPLVSLVLASTAASFALASAGPLDWMCMFWTVLGTALTACGANAFNQWRERGPDSRMNRTRRRPLPAQLISPGHAVLFAGAATAAGTLVLALGTNLLSMWLALGANALYVLVYTPMKKHSAFCTQVGAVCGAVPPLIGWAAAHGSLTRGAWLVAAVVFIWQIPHFLALSWVYRADYARGGFRVLSVVDASGRSTTQFSLLYSVALLPLGCALFVTGTTGAVCAAASVAAGCLMVFRSLLFCRKLSETSARRLFRASLIYLPVVFAFMLLDGPDTAHRDARPLAAASVEVKGL